MSGKETGQPKRSDVGYKRPPLEHRFKAGQKPPLRKKKPKTYFSSIELLWNILQEPLRVTVEGKVRWMTPSEIIINNGFLLADKGNATLRRLMSELLLTMDTEGEDPKPEFMLEPNYPSS